ITELLLYSSCVSENFYPFGPNNGDTVNPAVDDGSSSVILLNETFQFFGSNHNQLYVNNNGFLTFDQPVSSPYSSMFQSGYDIIAPSWSNWNTTKSGIISYRQVTSGGDLQQATSDINQYFPQLNFTATWVFIATWDNVAFYNMDTVRTVQILYYVFYLKNISVMFQASMLYCCFQAGFVTADSMIYFNILQYSSYTDLTFSSNVNVKGRWVFQTNINYEKGNFVNYLFPFHSHCVMIHSVLFLFIFAYFNTIHSFM
uniref:NIDO domain-containing protein n=1 Tax=Scleropages formosus TaxID=113540 RepID=A0A8C9VCT8_SCLFO